MIDLTTRRSIDAAFKQLKKLDTKMRNKIIRAAHRKGAKILAAKIKSEAPVETGATKRSVKVKAGKRKKGWIITNILVSGPPEAGYIGFVEFGTKDHEADPFIRRSVEAKQGEVVKAIRDEIQSGIENV